MRFPWKPIVGGLAGVHRRSCRASRAGLDRRSSRRRPRPSRPALPPQARARSPVTASGAVRVDPDTAIVNLGVQANAATGAEAMEQVNTSSAALTDALIAAGIAAEDIQTSGLSLCERRRTTPARSTAIRHR